MNVSSGVRWPSLVLIGVCLGSATASLEMRQGKGTALDVKLGLWEVTSSAKMSGVPPIEPSDKMTPEQRARMQAAMQAVAQNAAKPHTSRTCLTREKLEKTLFQDSGPSCKQTVITNSATVSASKVECTGAHPTTSEFRFEALTPESVRGSGTVTFGENQMTSAMTLTAKWIGASCGDVK